jgi:tetratricopeptide (TPR) repeat protein
MAQYYYAQSTNDQRVRVQRLATARDLAARASERERLLITAAWAEGNSDPTLRAVAETLTTRYPAELEGWVYLAQGLLYDGEYVAARDPLHRVLQADTAGIATGAPNCVGCRALFYLAGTYDFADSIVGVTRMGRLWTRLQPDAAAAWRLLATAYVRSERYREAHAALDRSMSAQPHDVQPAPEFARTGFYIYEERWDSALATLAPLVARGGPQDRAWARWWRSYVARNLGQFGDALAEARQFRTLMLRGAPPGPGEAEPEAALVGVALLEAGDARGSAALFDSVARYGWPQGGESQRARQRAWNLAHRATALAAAGDTASLRGMIVTIREAGRGSGLERDRRLHHYAAGLLWKARGRRDSAIAEFRATLYAPGVSFTRANLELGRALLEEGRAMEAVRVLGPVLRGGLEGPGLYIIRTEVRGLLGEAWLRAGNADSARVHLHQAAANWENGEPHAKAESVRWRALLDRIARP